MSLPGIAPVFIMTVNTTAQDLLAKLQSLLSDDARFTGSIAGNHMTLTVREQDRHFWSPWLNIELTEHDGKTHFRGRFTPHPSVWTGFAFSYFSLFVIAAFAAVWGMSQWMLDSRPTALWIALVCAILVVLLWWSAQIGQRLAREQMHAIKDAVNGILEPNHP